MTTLSLMRPRRRRPFVGLVSDTHGLMRPEALTALRGATHIVHAGDVGHPDVLAALATLAPVTAVRGNNDRDRWAGTLPETARLEVAGQRLFVVHERAHLVRYAVDDVDVIVVGHSHRPLVEPGPPYLLVNPGSAGPRRFRLPITVGRLYLRPDGAEAEIVELPQSPKGLTIRPASQRLR